VRFQRPLAARKTIESLRGFEVDFLDISTLSDEPYKTIFPCKACVSTAQPLCHWPCSCYPNHAMGQVNDWMNEIYPRWVAAHGVMILCPVHWYQAPASLKLMIDRWFADNGNPDQPRPRARTVTGEAARLRLSYPDISPAGHSRRPWRRRQTGKSLHVDRLAHGYEMDPQDDANRYWVGWYQPYATSHDDLDKDKALFAEVKNAALALANMVKLIRTGKYHAPDQKLRDPREK
jgi:hypothetical protein